MEYDEFIFKMPVENEDYSKDSRIVLSNIAHILDERINADKHKKNED